MTLNKMSNLFSQFYLITLRQKIKYKFTLLHKNTFFQQNLILLKSRRKFFIRDFSKKQKKKTSSKKLLQLNLIFLYNLKFNKTSFLTGAVQKPGLQKPCKSDAFARLLHARVKAPVGHASGKSFIPLEHQLSYQSLLANNNLYRSNYNKKLSSLYPTNLDKMSFLSSDLANLSLSLRTYLFLKEKKIHKIGHLVKYSSRSLLQLLNKDKEMFAEIKRCLFLTAIC